MYAYLASTVNIITQKSISNNKFHIILFVQHLHLCNTHSMLNNNNNDRIASVVVRLFTFKISIVRWSQLMYALISQTFSPHSETIWLGVFYSGYFLASVTHHRGSL